MKTTAHPELDLQDWVYADRQTNSPTLTVSEVEILRRSWALPEAREEYYARRPITQLLLDELRHLLAKRDLLKPQNETE